MSGAIGPTTSTTTTAHTIVWYALAGSSCRRWRDERCASSRAAGLSAMERFVPSVRDGLLLLDHISGEGHEEGLGGIDVLVEVDEVRGATRRRLEIVRVGLESRGAQRLLPSVGVHEGQEQLGRGGGGRPRGDPDTARDQRCRVTHERRVGEAFEVLQDALGQTRREVADRGTALHEELQATEPLVERLRVWRVHVEVLPHRVPPEDVYQAVDRGVRERVRRRVRDQLVQTRVLLDVGVQLRVARRYLVGCQQLDVEALEDGLG